jgi:hypothetical protein
MSSILKGLPLNEGFDFKAMQDEGKRKIAAINADPESYSEKYGVPLDHKHFVGAVLVAMDRAEQRERQVKRDAESKAKQEEFKAKQLAHDTENIEQLKGELAQLEKQFDPHYEYSDDHTFWSTQKDIASKISTLKKRISNVDGQQVNELSNDTLASYKKKAGADATKSDRLAKASYDIRDNEVGKQLTNRANKRMSGIMKATRKEFDNVNEGYIAEGKILIEARVTRKLWESAGQKIAEAQLTADQINQIFGYVEKIQTAGGENRTMLGKGKDAAGAVNKAWEDLKTKVQNSGPVQGFDAMYDKAAEKLKQATGGDQGAMTYVQKYRDFAKKHPVAQSLIYSALIAAAGISGAGVGGAAALGLFKMVDKLLQGEKFSSAAYSGAKTGAMAYGASKLADYMKGNSSAGSGSDLGEYPDGTPKMPGDDVATQAQHGDYSMVKNVKDGENSVVGQWSDKGPTDTVGSDSYRAAQAAKDFEKLDKASLGQSMKMDPMLAQRAGYPGIDSGGGSYEGAFKQGLAKFAANPSNPSANDIMRAKDYAGKVASGMLKPMKESVELSESQIFLMIGKIVDRQRKLDEGVMDSIKGAAGKAMDWAKTKGTNLTTKITADKLLQAWKKAGSPTDSLDVAKIVQDAGVPSDSIKQVYSNMKIPFAGEPGANSATRNIDADPSSGISAPAPQAAASPNQAPTSNPTATPQVTQDPAQTASTTPASTAQTPATGAATPVQTTYAQVRKLVDQLDKKGKQRVIKALEKSLGLSIEEGSMGVSVSDPAGSTVSAGQRFYKPRHVPNQDELQKQGMDEEKQRLDPKCWTGYKKQGTKMKGGVRVNNCVPVSESAILKGLK